MFETLDLRPNDSNYWLLLPRIPHIYSTIHVENTILNQEIRSRDKLKTDLTGHGTGRMRIAGVKANNQ